MNYTTFCDKLDLEFKKEMSGCPLWSTSMTLKKDGKLVVKISLVCTNRFIFQNQFRQTTMFWSPFYGFDASPRTIGETNLTGYLVRTAVVIVCTLVRPEFIIILYNHLQPGTRDSRVGKQNLCRMGRYIQRSSRCKTGVEYCNKCQYVCW